MINDKNLEFVDFLTDFKLILNSIIVRILETILALLSKPV